MIASVGCCLGESVGQEELAKEGLWSSQGKKKLSTNFFILASSELL